jgi:hypothetical protein
MANAFFSFFFFFFSLLESDVRPATADMMTMMRPRTSRYARTRSVQDPNASLSAEADAKFADQPSPEEHAAAAVAAPASGSSSGSSPPAAGAVVIRVVQEDAKTGAIIKNKENKEKESKEKEGKRRQCSHSSKHCLQAKRRPRTFRWTALCWVPK